MHFTTTAVAAILAATSVSAAPSANAMAMSNAAKVATANPVSLARVQAVQSSEAGEPDWTIVDMFRTCWDTRGYCDWTFGIQTHLTDDSVVACNFRVKANGNTPAEEATGTAQRCNQFQITSGWDGEYGPGNGFTTFAFVDTNRNRITFPSYQDSVVKDGLYVRPNRSFKVYVP